MVRNSITVNRCKHTGCMNYPRWGCGGYCEVHAQDDPMFATKAKKKKRTSAMLTVGNSPVTQWFEDGAADLLREPRCMNCGAPIYITDFGASTAHVLPKKKRFGFPSIATHALNRIYLGAACGCHTRYDSSWLNACQMKIWPLVLATVKRLLPFISPSELKNLPEIFNTSKIEKQ